MKLIHFKAISKLMMNSKTNIRQSKNSRAPRPLLKLISAVWHPCNRDTVPIDILAIGTVVPIDIPAIGTVKPIGIHAIGTTVPIDIPAIGTVVPIGIHAMDIRASLHDAM